VKRSQSVALCDVVIFLIFNTQSFSLKKKKKKTKKKKLKKKGLKNGAKKEKGFF